MTEQISIVGRGRMGRALTAALTASGWTVDGPHGRGASHAVGAVLLCVPDAELAPAAAAVAPGLLLGHCSGATTLEVLGDRERFGLHPLMTVTGEGAALAGAACAIDGSTPRALGFAHALADALQMRAIHVARDDRAAYHAAASIASNFLVTLECAAERLGATAGLRRADLAPLVRATVDNWEQDGPAALTGPIARGDAPTVAAHRDAIALRTPELLGLYDALADATRAVAA